ncbi:MULTISPECIES: hypothetical protein [Bacillus]|uniref:hypothetical protein n=1 Tax=Bacillus TaxID=1386 RepID=UPI0009DE4272|nr:MULTISPECIES: hypothetical protein [Bacillus]MED0963354.1 hypothetical protein [Bacillus paramycoides]MED1412179.1 hypothetical protein [Bacillus paramycoides]MED1466755.1 hypothetical protein [Bacillus paramycoides]MED1495245.1 hypothetical protein [Bacillus paramycoides]
MKCSRDETIFSKKGIRHIIGTNFLVHNIYYLVVGKEFHFNMWSSIIIFSIVFISGFAYMLKKGPDILIND